MTTQAGSQDFWLLDEHHGTVASEGEVINVGGGMDAADEVFLACWYVSRNPP
jgi:hypothetical protein